MSAHPLYIASAPELARVIPILDAVGDEFCFSDNFSPSFIDALCQHGFLPMALPEESGEILLIKLHFNRCVLILPPGPVPKKVQKRAAGFVLTVDRAFGRCLEGIARHHPNNWIVPSLAEAFLALHREPLWRTRFHSVEIWEGEDLVAGEIGFAVGGSYCSLSGFYNRSGAGTLQLHATARLLHTCGFIWWDLGMALPYKLDLGAEEIPRHVFIERFRSVREGRAALATSGGAVGALLS